MSAQGLWRYSSLFLPLLLYCLSCYQAPLAAQVPMNSSFAAITPASANSSNLAGVAGSNRPQCPLPVVSQAWSPWTNRGVWRNTSAISSQVPVLPVPAVQWAQLEAVQGLHFILLQPNAFMSFTVSPICPRSTIIRRSRHPGKANHSSLIVFMAISVPTMRRTTPRKSGSRPARQPGVCLLSLDMISPFVLPCCYLGRSVRQGFHITTYETPGVTSGLLLSCRASSCYDWSQGLYSGIVLRMNPKQMLIFPVLKLPKVHRRFFSSVQA